MPESVPTKPYCMLQDASKCSYQALLYAANLSKHSYQALWHPAKLQLNKNSKHSDDSH